MGLIRDGYPEHQGMKAADVDLRCRQEHCCRVSDKAALFGGPFRTRCVLRLGTIRRRRRGRKKNGSANTEPYGW